MKNITITILASVLLIITGCKKDEDSSNIYGSWTVIQTDYDQGINYSVKLKINTDNTFDWILLDTVEGHTNSHASFTLNQNVFLITEDTDCSTLGEYYVVIESEKLAIIVIADECTDRASGLEYIWQRIQ